TNPGTASINASELMRRSRTVRGETWPEHIVLKVGARLIDLILKSALICNANIFRRPEANWVSKSASTPTSEFVPAFRHQMIRQAYPSIQNIGVIVCD